MREERNRSIVGLGVSRWVHAGGLMLAAIGVLLQFLTGVPGFPPVPPGPIILAVAAVVVSVVRWRWIVVLGLAVSVFVTIGALGSGETLRLLASGAPFGQLTGIGLQLFGLLVALVAGIVALARRSPRVETAA